MKLSHNLRVHANFGDTKTLQYKINEIFLFPNKGKMGKSSFYFYSLK